jgi:hypothetical protein
MDPYLELEVSVDATDEEIKFQYTKSTFNKETWYSAAIIYAECPKAKF